MNYLFTLSYVGTSYCGWQFQPNAVSVQQVFQDTAQRLFGKRFPVTGCSRTDSGVHAKGFICTMKTDNTESRIPVDRIPVAMNSLLPDDISVLGCEIVPNDFHPRYGTYGKEYSYHFFDGKSRDPFRFERVWDIRTRLDDELMNEASKLFVGEHDFSSFCSVGTSDENHIRTMYSSKVERIGDEVVFSICGNGFLYNMVRIMAGTLCSVGMHRASVKDIKSALLCDDRTLAGITAPACGLYLEKVFREPFSE